MNLTADGVRACSGQHAVEDRHADRHFALLSLRIACPQTRADQRLVTAHRGFDQGPPTITGRFLPTEPPVCRDRLEMTIARRGRPLIETVLANLAWPEDAQLPEDVKRLTSGVSTVCQAVGTLRTHYGSAHGTSTHLPPLDPAFATLAKNAGAAVAIFLLDRHRHGGGTTPPGNDR